jgi:hypothetical protein
MMAPIDMTLFAALPTILIAAKRRSRAKTRTRGMRPATPPPAMSRNASAAVKQATNTKAPTVTQSGARRRRAAAS